MDKDFDGKIDTKIVESDRDGRWNISYYDTNADGIYDLIGHHPDGKITASRFSEYVPKS